MMLIFKRKKIIGQNAYWCWDPEANKGWYANRNGQWTMSSVYKYPQIPSAYDPTACIPQWVYLQVGTGL